MNKSKLKVAGLFVFILVLTFTMAACDMVGENAVEDTAGEAIKDSGTGELEIVVNGEDLESEVGAQSVVYNRFTDFELEFYIEYKKNTDINYTETISIDDAEKEELFDIANYEFRIVAVREQEDDFDLTSDACEGVIIDEKGNVLNPGEENGDDDNDEKGLEPNQEETAWAGDSEGEGSGWWYYYDTEAEANNGDWYLEEWEQD